MTGTASRTTTDLAPRSSAPGRAQASQGTALAIRPGQDMWTDKQLAALVSLGIPKTAPKADLAVFMHQCQRTGLDPFIKQIYLIYRRTKENGQWVDKPTTQTGIDGYRLIRDRIAKREQLRVEYEPTVWWDGEGQPHQAWLWDEPPAGCTVTILVDGRRFSSTLRFREYAQYKDRDNGVLNSMWATKSAHMIEKCCEADVLRRAFPQDLSGVTLEDETDPDAYVQPAPQQQRATAAQIRQQRPAVKAEVVQDEPEVPDVPEHAFPAGIAAQAKRLGLDDAETARAVTVLSGGQDPASLGESDVAEVTAKLAGFTGRGDLIAALAGNASS